ncbi:MAG TPA: hypothetical protein VLM79_26170 [Kofleriaceae bacterium]|nr:hypothetical protein [Kofleriaceae bacterium]
MHNHNNTADADIEIAEPSESINEPVETMPWHAEVGRFLTQAAELCVEHGVDLESFMKGAWSAYVETRPGMRDYLEEMQLRDQLDEIRKLGHMAEA